MLRNVTQGLRLGWDDPRDEQFTVSEGRTRLDTGHGLMEVSCEHAGTGNFLARRATVRFTRRSLLREVCYCAIRTQKLKIQQMDTAQT
jgi:hypothetical protein